MTTTPGRADQHLGIEWVRSLVVPLLLLAGIAPALAPSLSQTTVTYAASPPYTVSHYEETTAASDYYYQGCDMGKSGLSGVAVLDFGQPAYESGQGYGTLLFNINRTFVPTSTIAGLAENYLVGFWNCSTVGPFLTLGIGTSNDFGWTNYSHGATWAQMVNGVGLWIASKGYTNQEAAAGASDIQDDWNKPPDPQDEHNIGPTTDWVNGYDTYYSWHYYDYGDAGGCPTSYPPPQPPNCNNQWSQENMWYDSWGAAAAYPLPEIYISSQANEWQQISLYGYLNQGGQVYMQGSFTDWAASGYCTNGCTNEPGQGWTDLYNALNADQRMSQGLPYSSDISYSQT
jgi:hypothetical protein